MAIYHEIKEITQLEESLMTFQLQPYLDDQFRNQPIGVGRVVMTSGTSPYEPTFRITVKAKEDDTDAFALFQKTVPPYPDNALRTGIQFNGRTYLVTGGILYVDGQPWWNLPAYRATWPPGYTYSATSPPTNWDPLGIASGGLPIFLQAFDPFMGEVSFFIERYDSWFPPGDYFGTLEMWQGGNGTPPANAAPRMVLQFTMRINKTSRRSPIF